MKDTSSSGVKRACGRGHTHAKCYSRATTNSVERAAKYQKAYEYVQKPALNEISADFALNVIMSVKMA